MKKNLLATVVIPTLFCTALLLMFVAPALLSARGDDSARAYRYLDAPHREAPHGTHLRPGLDGEADALAAKRVPVDAALPDAAIIALPDAKKRTTTIKA